MTTTIDPCAMPDSRNSAVAYYRVHHITRVHEIALCKEHVRVMRAEDVRVLGP